MTLKYTKEYKKYMLDKIGDQSYTPLSKAQSELMKADFQNIHEVTMGGAAEGGKTTALLISSLGPQMNEKSKSYLLVDNPSYRGLIFRREAAQLEKTSLIKSAQEWYKKFFPKVEYNGSLKRFTFPSGATITFAGCESEDDALKYKGFTSLHFVGFEELTQFTKFQFEFLSTRLRDINNNIPLRIRATTNPGDIHEDWVLERYKYWLYNSCATPLQADIEAKYGQPLYMYANEDDPDNSIVITDKVEGKEEEIAKKFLFIETYAGDILDTSIQNMARISDPVLREQLLKGKWGLKGGAGMYFTKGDFPESTNKAGDLAVRIRYWDKACSGPKGDYLSGTLVAHYMDPTSKFMIEDIVLCKPNVSEVESIILKTAKKDGKFVYVGFEQEPGSSGKEIIEKYKALLQKEGFRVVVDTKKATKLDRAGFISPLAKDHLISYVDGPGILEMFNQLTNFPSNGVHDDAVDSLTGAIFMLQNHLPRPMSRMYIKTVNKSSYARLEEIMNTPSVFRS